MPVERADRRKLEREKGYSFVPKDPKHSKTIHDTFNVGSFRIVLTTLFNPY